MAPRVDYIATNILKEEDYPRKRASICDDPYPGMHAGGDIPPLSFLLFCVRVFSVNRGMKSRSNFLASFLRRSEATPGSR